ncbi:MAG: hypothetical protein CVT92_01925 [Bacteroidetes bacterium HGW-Bacteroidetes-1]|jgi:hypothetical protein|nr:MAG: hypothetical protein CVT92_01925 [Bacteroidetes bacterium HGW-Bacteroidetes-1]
MEINHSLSSTTNLTKKWILKLCLSAMLLVHTSTGAVGQSSNSDFERVKIFGPEFIFSNITMSPDGNTIAVSSKKSSPVTMLDWKNRQEIKKIDAGKWVAGSRINYSATGTYLLLQEMNLYDLVENKNRKLHFEIVEAESGKIIKDFQDVQDVIITTDEQQAVSLQRQEITFWSLANGTKLKSFQVSGASDAIAISPDGSTIAVSHSVTKADLKGDRRFKKKKAAKKVIRYKQLVSFYNTTTFEKLKTVNEFYDIVYRLRFSNDGDHLFVFQIPHLKVQTSKQTLTYVTRVDGRTYEALRGGLTSQSIGQPDIRLSHNGQLFAINSKGNKFQEIHLYDFTSGTLLQRFELGQRLFEKGSEGEKLIKDSRPSFLFLPGDASILITMGNQMIIWNLDTNQ